MSCFPSMALLVLTPVFALLLLPLLAHARACTEGFLKEAARFNVTQHCLTQALHAEFVWNFDNNTKHLDVAFGTRLDADTAWLAWGVNLEAPRMVGTGALIGIKNGTAPLQWDKYKVTDATKRGCQLQPTVDIGLDVRNFSFIHLKAIRYYMIHATIVLPKEHNISRTHFVWQVGEAASGKEPLMHPKTLDNLDSAETVDLLASRITSYKPHIRRRLRIVHGVLNMLGWGILVPVGVIVARYFRKFPLPWPSGWFPFHVSCQISGYVIGVIGWSIGLCLGEFSKYYTFLTHRILAIIIFTFFTIQMMALRLKPKSYDEYRTYWNMYHHSLGYVLLALIAANIFQGIKIMQPYQGWKWAYVGVLGLLGSVALGLEIHTWKVFLGFKACLQALAGSRDKASDNSTASTGAVHSQPEEEPTANASK